jgi:hypothetical protein
MYLLELGLELVDVLLTLCSLLLDAANLHLDLSVLLFCLNTSLWPCE